MADFCKCSWFPPFWFTSAWPDSCEELCEDTGTVFIRDAGKEFCITWGELWFTWGRFSMGITFGRDICGEFCMDT